MGFTEIATSFGDFTLVHFYAYMLFWVYRKLWLLIVSD